MNDGMDPALRCVRSMIDVVDTGMVGLLAVRHRLARAAGLAKRLQGRPVVDLPREARVRTAILAMAIRLGVSPTTASSFASLLIAEGHTAQGMSPEVDLVAPSSVLSFIPFRVQRMTADAVMARLLSEPLACGELDFLSGRRIGIEVRDLGARWVITLESGRLRTCEPDATADATVRAQLRDLLLLATRQADADTLFFQ